MTTTILPPPLNYDMRVVDVAVAEHLIGYRRETVQPSWYRVPVDLFSIEFDGRQEVVYSYDANACNAMIFRNRVDDKMGYAQPLPRYSSEIHVAWVEVLDAVTRFQPPQRARFRDLMKTVDLLAMTEEQVAMRICLTALAALDKLKDLPKAK